MNNRGWQACNVRETDNEVPDFSAEDCFDEDYDESPLASDKNRRYREAYGDYDGGYGPSGPYRPQRFAPYPGPPGGPPRGPPGGPSGFRRPPFGPQFRPGFRRDMGPPLLHPPPEGPEFGPPCGPGFRPGFRRSPGPPGFRRFDQGEGHGLGGPRSFDELTLRFLTRCGIPGHVLNCLPSDLVALITPKCCHLCNIELNAFDQARLHYNSKKHSKNQGKWLAVNGFSQPNMTITAKDEPMKSRDLYCELCDIQITSKAHGDSHYAGRPHRAIIDGRKPPKNLALCQPGMAARVDKLIRREKKLGVLAMPLATPADTPQKDTKPIPPELTCDICKTSMTNTEQMTMHLNGKRHLTKEKQFILNAMKGGLQPTDGGQMEEGEDIKEEREEVNEQEDQVEEEINEIAAADY